MLGPHLALRICLAIIAVFGQIFDVFTNITNMLSTHKNNPHVDDHAKIHICHI